jgi:hypothetical protein
MVQLHRPDADRMYLLPVYARDENQPWSIGRNPSISSRMMIIAA